MRNISDLPSSGSEEEYISLRDEIIERVSIMNNQSSSAFGATLTVWAAGFTCFGIMAATWSETNQQIMKWISLCPIGVFLISMLILLPMGIKSGENIRQIIAIGSFIKVYYEYIPTLKDPNKQYISWETANALVNRGITNKEKKQGVSDVINRRIDDCHNAEYTLLCIASSMLMIIALSVFYELFPNMLNIAIYYILGALLFLFSVFWISTVYIQSNAKRNAKNANILFTKEFLILAVEKNILSEEEAKKAWNDLNPKNEVDRIRLDTLFK